MNRGQTDMDAAAAERRKAWQAQETRRAQKERDARARRKAKRAERQIHSHFAGRRAARRVETLVECRVSGGRGVFRALAVDMSRSGALLRITDPRFLDGDEHEALVQFSFRVGSHFADCVEIAFLGGALPVVADVVRVTSRVDEETNQCAHLMGVRFRTELSGDECEKIGIDDSDDSPLAGYSNSRRDDEDRRRSS